MNLMLVGEVDGESLTSKGHGETTFNRLGVVFQVDHQSFCKALGTLITVTLA